MLLGIVFVKERNIEADIGETVVNTFLDYSDCKYFVH